jgi:TPR repeat protein
MEEIKQLILELETENKHNYNKSEHLKYLIKNTKIDESLINWLKEESCKKNTWAQNIFGYMYEYGFDVEQDYKEAIRLFKLSAEQENSDSQNNLGYMYQNGFGVERDYKEAVRLFKLSAEQGNSFAQNNLGYVYQYGFGVEIDHTEAIRLYKLSANQENIYAETNLKFLFDENEDIFVPLFLADDMKIKELEKKNKELEKKMKELEKEIEELKYMAPLEGGPEYQKAKKNFEEKQEKLENIGSLDIEDHK